MGWEQRVERRSVLPAVLPQPSIEPLREHTEEPQPARVSSAADHTHLKAEDYKPDGISLTVRMIFLFASGFYLLSKKKIKNSILQRFSQNFSVQLRFCKCT